jgi:hypothetical protein
VALLTVAMLAAGTFAILPATAAKNLTRKRAKNLFYTKALADARFLNLGETGTLGAVTAQDYKYATAQTNSVVVPGAAFFGDTPSALWTHDEYSGSVGCDGAECVTVAPVYLPNGAVVTRVLWQYDDGPAGDANLHLESNFGDGDHDDMIDVVTDACATSPCTKTISSISFNPIDNVNRHYGLYLDGSDAHFTYKVVIEYTTTSVGPATG